MKRKLYGNRIEPRCDVCRFGRRMEDKDTVLCTRKGAVSASFCCRHYDYDPLRRIPSRPLLQKEEHSAEEFEL